MSDLTEDEFEARLKKLLLWLGGASAVLSRYRALNELLKTDEDIDLFSADWTAKFRQRINAIYEEEATRHE